MLYIAIALFKHDRAFEEAKEITIFHGSFPVLLHAYIKLLVVAEQVTTLSWSFQIEELVDLEVLEDIVHDHEVQSLLVLLMICKLDHVKAKEAADKTIRVISHVHEVFFEHGSEFNELTLRNRLEHILFVLGVVKEWATLAGRAQFIKHVEVVGQEALDYLLRAQTA